MKRWVLIFVLLSLVGCDRTPGPLPKDPKGFVAPVEKSPVPEWPARTLEEMEGLPIPEVATPDPKNTEDTLTYLMPTGTPIERLRAWYTKRLPMETAWKDWTWCEGKTPHGATYDEQRTWHKPGTSQILTVVTAPGERPGIILGRDESGPCSTV